MDTNKSKYDFNDLVEIIKILRSPDGCPWDKVQTHESLKSNLIEESYEFLSEIDKNNIDGMKEELGDVLLQVVMHAEIAKSDEEFDIDDVIDGIAKKMIFRHPHVFATEKAENVDNAYDIFKKQKEKEKHFTKQVDVLKSIPDSFPALMKSEKIINKLYKMYPDFAEKHKEQILVKLKEEVQDLDEGVSEEQIGKIMMDLVVLSKKMDIEPEIALAKCSKAIIDKFEEMEDNGENLGLRMENLEKLL